MQIIKESRIQSCTSPTAQSSGGGSIRASIQDDEDEEGSVSRSHSQSAAKEQLVGAESGGGRFSLSHSATMTAKLAGLSGQICETLNKVLAPSQHRTITAPHHRTFAASYRCPCLPFSAPHPSKLHWNRADVIGRLFLAHDDMIVRSAMFNSSGAPIIQHMVDNLWE
jgi:hypothetical protein